MSDIIEIAKTYIAESVDQDSEEAHFAHLYVIASLLTALTESVESLAESVAAMAADMAAIQRQGQQLKYYARYQPDPALRPADQGWAIDMRSLIDPNPNPDMVEVDEPTFEIADMEPPEAQPIIRQEVTA